MALLLVFGTAPLGLTAESPAGLEFFERKVRPLLAENCYACHDGEKQKGKLRLDSPAFIRAGGETGAVIVPGEPGKSRLVIAVGYQDEDLKMPPKKRLSPQQVNDLSEWVKLGAPMPASDAPAPVAVKKEFQITDKDRAHWAFQPVKRPAVPGGSNQSSVFRVQSGKSAPGGKNSALNAVPHPIDAFILAKLAEKQLVANPSATLRALMRRACYDLTGLPPTPEEVEAFVADKSPRAWEQLIDRLLESPRYGEKWGRHWLDLVRFAESNSYERDGDKPNAWRFRDYVIRAFNADKPYDRFLREQLAGDELPNPDSDAIIATGYYRLGIWDDEPADREIARYDNLDDLVATTSQVFLGLTVDCARCHNHKIDPIPQRDYYRLLSFFQNVNQYRNGGPTDEVPLIANEHERLAYAERLRARDKERSDLQAVVHAAEARFRSQLGLVEETNIAALFKKDGLRVLGQETINQVEKAKRALAALNKENVHSEMVLAVTERGAVPPETFLLGRGNPNLKGEVVEPGFIEVLNPPKAQIPVPAPGAKSSGRRTVLANWIASPDNQLTARVMVNRIWQHHFGRGLVRSSNNFGTQGDRPTHPELLDWLASEFVARGWSVKAMHRLIMTSQAYRMSSRGNDAALRNDPANDLFWRFDMRRLTAEEIRDSILAINGTLNLKMFGLGIFVDIPREVMAGQSMPGKGWGKSPPEEQARRSVYIKVKRSLLTPILESFDMAEPDRTAPVRFTTIQPTQALGMLNGAFLNQQAELFAARLRQEAGEDVKQQVRRGLQLVTTRPPTDVEVKRGVHLIETLRTQDNESAEVALKYFCLMALNLNELVYVD